MGLVAEQVQRLRRRADKGDALLRAAPRQRGILAQKAVAGMQRAASGSLGSGDDRLDIEIGPRAASRDFVSLVRAADMQRQRIVGGVNRDGDKAGFACGARDANGNLAAISDQ